MDSGSISLYSDVGVGVGGSKFLAKYKIAPDINTSDPKNIVRMIRVINDPAVDPDVKISNEKNTKAIVLIMKSMYMIGIIMSLNGSFPVFK